MRTAVPFCRLVVATLALVAACVHAQVQVEESVPTVTDRDSLYPVPRGKKTGTAPPPVARPASPAPAPAAQPVARQPNQTAEMFYQLQTLQQEIMELRGLVEEHEQSIRQLKQQRLDDYKSLDRRIADMSQNGVPGNTVGSEARNPGNVARSGQTAVNTLPQVGEEEAYRTAYGLVRDRQFDQAMVSFEEFVTQFPDGSYAPNGYYWLGELYLLKGMNAKARQSFETLLSRFSDNRKVPDAMFKLAKVHHLEGRNQQAKQLLDQVISDYANSAAARLASGYLQQNF